MIVEFFSTILYEPLFNLLVWLYNNYTAESFGWAVIFMTVGLRIAMLPLSIISERNKLRYASLERRIGSIKRDYHKDPVGERVRIRQLTHDHGVSPWAKTMLLLIQGLIFVVLYWVFIRGVNNQKIAQVLYEFVDHPGLISTDFYGFDIAKRSMIWSGLVGILMYIVIWLEQKGMRMTKSEMYFRIFFPLGIFLFLWLLPMVKSLFFMTSIMFSAVLIVVRKIFIKAPKASG